MNTGETRTRANFLWLLCRWRRVGFPSGIAERIGLGIGLIISDCGTRRKNMDAAALRGRAGHSVLPLPAGPGEFLQALRLQYETSLWDPIMPQISTSCLCGWKD